MQTLKSPADIAATDDWARDNATGRELGAAYLQDARDNGSPVALAYAMKGMAEAGRWTGVEVGFVFTLAAAAL
jgi:hypothetical protein